MHLFCAKEFTVGVAIVSVVGVPRISRLGCPEFHGFEAGDEARDEAGDEAGECRPGKKLQELGN